MGCRQPFLGVSHSEELRFLIHYHGLLLIQLEGGKVGLIKKMIYIYLYRTDLSQRVPDDFISLWEF